jgi:hypothetical protein
VTLELVGHQTELLPTSGQTKQKLNTFATTVAKITGNNEGLQLARVGVFQQPRRSAFDK